MFIAENKHLTQRRSEVRATLGYKHLTLTGVKLDDIVEFKNSAGNIVGGGSTA